MALHRARTVATALGSAFALALLATVPAAAATGGFDCEASAVRGTVLGQAIEPAVANRGAGACKSVTAGAASPLPAPFGGDLVIARTLLEVPAGDPSHQRASAAGGIGGIQLQALPNLPIQLPTAQLSAALGAITVPLPSLTGATAPLSAGTGAVTGGLGSALGGTPLGGVVGGATTSVTGAAATLPSSITLDLRPALQALLPNGGLPKTNLVSVANTLASATGRCVDGRPELTGLSQVTGLQVLGQDIPVGAAVDQALTLVDTTSISPSSIDLSKIPLPAGLSFSDPAVGTILQNAVRGVLASLPPVEIPATVAQVKVTPGGQTRTANALTQQALHVAVSLAGQSLADVVVGEAIVRVANGTCSPAEGAVSPSQAALQCTKRRLVLTDVLQRGSRVSLVGAADKSLVGKTVGIVFRATGRTVARVKVAKDGSFRTTAALPSKALRSTNRARYQARYGRERSLDLKLVRRMTVTGVSAKGGSVRISGRVSRPLASPTKTITLTRRVTCSKSEVVKRFKPRSNGSFSVTVAAPKGVGVAVYRFATHVRKTTRNPKLFPTFTLPRAVTLR